MTDQVIRLACSCGARVFCRGDYQLPATCEFRQSLLTTSSAPPPDNSGCGLPPIPLETATDRQPPVRWRLFVAEIVCLLCGRDTGTAMAEHWPPTGPILFQPPDAPRPSVVRAWWRVRCPACGGNTTAAEVTRRTIRVETVDWNAESPRRGRPPKWLVEQRHGSGLTPHSRRELG